MPATSYPKAQATSVSTVGDLEVVDDLTIDANGIIPVDDSDMPIGSSTKRFTEGWLDGPLVVDPAGAAVQADAGTDADDLILGNNASATATGLTLLTTAAGTAKLAFGDDSDADAGSLQYLHGSNRLDAYTGGTKRLELDSTGLTLKGTGSDLTVEGTGTSTFAGNVSVASSLLLGDASGTPTAIWRKSEAGTSVVIGLRSGGTSASDLRWRLQFDGSEDLFWRRFDAAGGGVDNPLVLNWSTGDVTLANRLGVGGATIGDAGANARSIVVGQTDDSTNYGITIFSQSTNVGSIFFGDEGDNDAGFIQYRHDLGTPRMDFRAEGTLCFDARADGVRPSADNGRTLGSATLRWSGAHAMEGTFYTSMDVGDGAGSPTLDIDKADAGATLLRFLVAGADDTQGVCRLHHDTSEALIFDRHNGTSRETAMTITGDASSVHWGVFGSASSQAAAYTPTNVSTDRAFDADTVAVAELADVVGTLIADLQAYGLLQ